MRNRTFTKAYAVIRGGKTYPRLTGIVRFAQNADGVMIETEITGLPGTEAGFFAFHIHDGGSCAGDGFPDTGSHFNPGNTMHPNHAGDLPPLLADHGRAYMKVFTDRFHLEEIIGKTVIIHSSPDDFRTQPSGNAGIKIACGVIQRIKRAY